MRGNATRAGAQLISKQRAERRSRNQAAAVMINEAYTNAPCGKENIARHTERRKPPSHARRRPLCVSRKKNVDLACAVLCVLNPHHLFTTSSARALRPSNRTRSGENWRVGFRISERIICCALRCAASGACPAREDANPGHGQLAKVAVSHATAKV